MIHIPATDLCTADELLAHGIMGDFDGSDSEDLDHERTSFVRSSSTVFDSAGKLWSDCGLYQD